jgi:hypothetical protein
VQEPLTENKRIVLDIDGLDQVFEADCEPIEHRVSTVPAGFDYRAKQGVSQGAGMSLKAAAIHYRLAMSTLRAKIKRGEIPAEKIDGVNGPEWRVFTYSSVISNPIDYRAKQGAEHGAATLLDEHQSNSDESINRLVELVDKQAAKLEVASGQIGYLSAQIENYQNQVKLLPDLEEKAAKVSAQDETINQLSEELTKLKGSWWYRFVALFSFTKKP